MFECDSFKLNEMDAARLNQTNLNSEAMLQYKYVSEKL